MMTDDPPRWGDHHGWQRGDQRDDGGTDFLWCRCHQGLAAHPKSCKIAAIAPQIDVEHAKMRGYILASFFFFLDFTACTFRPFPSRFWGYQNYGCWMLDAAGDHQVGIGPGSVCTTRKQTGAKNGTGSGHRQTGMAFKTSKKLQTMVCMCVCVYNCVYI